MDRINNVLVSFNLPFLTTIFLSISKLWFKTKIPNKQMNKNRVVVITGCDTGIGFELAKQVFDWGYHVVACCLDLESNGARVLDSMSVDVKKVDVCSEKMVKQFTEQISDMHRQGKVIWCLVNNAGVMTYAKVEWLTWDLVQAQLSVNIGGTVHMTRSLMPFIREAKGRVVNVSSPQGMIASPYMGVYCASKWGTEAFSHCLRREVSACGVKSIIVRPCNFPHKTSILKQNASHLLKMKAEMSEETLREYKAELEVLQTNFEAGFAKVQTNEQINDQYLIKCFRSAIESPSPSRSYTAAPLMVRLLLGTFQFLPDCLMDVLVRWDIHTTIINWGKIA